MQNQWENNVYAKPVSEVPSAGGGQADVVYAGFFVRLMAFAVDSLIAALIISIIGLPVAIRASFGGGSSFWTSNFIFDYSLIDVLKYLGVTAYFVLLTYFSHSTLGKMLFRLEVVTGDGEWTFVNILYRETVGRFLSSILNIGYLAVLVTQGKQGFHDMLCDTNVVYAKMAPVRAAKPNVARQTETDRPVSAFELPESHPISTAQEPVKQEDE